MFDTTNETAAQVHADTAAAAKPVLTKEGRVAKLLAEIAKLEKKIYNIENDIVEVKAKKEVVLPEVGAAVTFSYGRRTATTEPAQKSGVVVAVKPKTERDGKTLPAQIKVQIGDGFDAEFVVIYPAQIVAAVVAE